ncbi:oligosaccharide repeat unit polymerase [Irregularibacter muris]|uniref:Oligosaccharide repeat unit polymerase n=1 Tax=Irregularibacter muris TaxID=1796619 RepID=A0AAE3HIZ5_9FIRM|nr:O-antigen polymerase [Irregularibacter muris]MCR1900058.1 oligosaccharide repeat unit polymerase [Irregularibacter muris]
MKNLKLLTGILIIVIFLISVLFSENNNMNLSMVLIILSSSMMLFWVKGIVGNYTNMTFFFVAFHILYGISGPINVLWGDGLHRIFSQSYNLEPFILAYSLASIGLVIGIAYFNLLKKRSSDYSIEENALSTIQHKNTSFYKISILFSIIASSFEVINLIRVGGIEILFGGKATYQSLISTLPLTLPSTEIIVLSYTLFGLYLSTADEKKHKRKIINSIMFLIITLPFLSIKMLLGQRGILLTLFVCLFIGITYFKPIRKIKPKIVVIMLVLYLFMSFLFANRSIAFLIVENPSLFIEQAFSKERLLDALNPGSSEFGTTFGNFNEFYNKYNVDFQLELGSSYLEGLVIPIPSFIYPGSKPKQITYVFRDEFFLSEASRGSIAGTGFSSLLEAYMNFHYIGIFIVYAILAFYLQKTDKIYRYRSLYMMLLYLSTISLTISFHRSAFGTVFSSIFLIAVLVFILTKTLKITVKTNQ